MTRLAIVDGQGRVVTFVRADTPAGWQPPDGCRAVSEASLPAGWRMAPPPAQPVPESITAVQARHWLICRGMLAGVDAAIERIESPVERERVRVWWEYEPVLRRDSPQVSRWADAIGLTDQQVDDAFREAGAIAT